MTESLLPYVKLTSLHQGYERGREYIAAQGPLPDTVVDFWRMIWEYDVPTVVMLTNLTEKMKIKCSQYWPDKDTASYGPFTVTLVNTVTLADFVTRHMNVTNVSEVGDSGACSGRGFVDTGDSLCLILLTHTSFHSLFRLTHINSYSQNYMPVERREHII